jgi:hypothetical protein
MLDERVESKHQIKMLGSKTNPGNFVVAHAAAETAIRGHHPQKLLIDEADVAEYSNLEHAKGLPTQSPTSPEAGILTCYSSTHHRYGGTMSRLLREFREKERTLGRKLVYSWCWREQMVANGGHITKKYIRTKKQTLSQAQWDAEYENKGPQSGTRIFDVTQLAHLFNPQFGTIAGVENEWYHFGDRSALSRNYHGLDWAREMHSTVLDTLGVVGGGLQRMAWYRTNKKPYPQICREAVDHMKEYRGPVCHDATGVGVAMDDLLVDYGMKRKSVLAMDWARAKLVQEACTLFVHAVQNLEISGPMIEWAYSEHLYLTQEMLTGKDHCPDSVAAALMAHYMAKQRGTGQRTSIVMRLGLK